MSDFNFTLDAKLSKAVYDNDVVSTTVVEGWQPIYVEDNSGHEYSATFGAQLYEKDGQYKLVYRGTEGKLADWATNLDYGKGTWNAEFADTIQFAAAALKQVAAQYPDLTLAQVRDKFTTTGHSQGGFEGELSSILFGFKGTSLDGMGATGIAAQFTQRLREILVREGLETLAVDHNLSAQDFGTRIYTTVGRLGIHVGDTDGAWSWSLTKLIILSNPISGVAAATVGLSAHPIGGIIANEELRDRNSIWRLIGNADDPTQSPASIAHNVAVGWADIWLADNGSNLTIPDTRPIADMVANFLQGRDGQQYDIQQLRQSFLIRMENGDYLTISPDGSGSAVTKSGDQSVVKDYVTGGVLNTTSSYRQSEGNTIIAVVGQGFRSTMTIGADNRVVQANGESFNSSGVLGTITTTIEPSNDRLMSTVTTIQNNQTLVVQYRENSEGNLVADQVLSINGQPPADDRPYIAALNQQGITPWDLAENRPGVNALPTFNTDGTSRPMTPAELLSACNPAKRDALADLSAGIATLTDIMSLVKAIQSGQPLPVVASGLRVVIDYQRLTQDGKVDRNLAGAGNIAGGLLSFMSLDAALKRGDALDVVAATANTVNYVNQALISWQSSLASPDINGFLNGGKATGVGSCPADGGVGSDAAGALAYINLAQSIKNGDAVGTAMSALAIWGGPPGQAIAAAYAVFNMITSLFGDDEEIIYVPAPTMWGEVHYTWRNNVMVPDSMGEGGGDGRVTPVLVSLTDDLQARVDAYNRLNPDYRLGLVAQRLPGLIWREGRLDDATNRAGWKLIDIDPFTAQERQPDLRYDDNFRPYTAAADSREQFWSLNERFVNVALERGAIAAQWEVDTARWQATLGIAKAGLAEEEWAAKAGVVAPQLDPAATSQVFRPITLDLDGSGRIERSADVSFNADDSGYLKRSDWIAAQDGMLFLDRNLNGHVDGGKELFSNALVGDGMRGLNALEWTDADGNGVINADDPVFNQLRVWQDSNGNGIEDQTLTNGAVSGHPELQTLAQLGITSLNYRMATFTRNGVDQALLSQRLSADTAGNVVVPVEGGLKVFASDGTTSLIVTAVGDNSPVEAMADHLSGIEEDIAFRVSVASLLANDQLGGIAGAGLQLDMDAFAGKGVGNASRGTVTVAGNGYVVFTPDRDYHGAAGFSYGVKAFNGQTAIANVSFTIAARNDDPVAWVEFDGGRTNASTGSANVTGRIRYSDIDDPASSLTIRLTGLAQMGNVSLGAPGVDAAGVASVAFTYANRSYQNTIGVSGTGVQDDPFRILVTDPHAVGGDYDPANTTDGALELTVGTQHAGTYNPGIYTPPPVARSSGGKKPITIDLANNGFQFTDVDDSNVFFEVNNDGWKHRVSWTRGDDAFLAYDENGDGKIDHGAELSFSQYLMGAQTDMEGLRTFDSNNDGKLSALDEKWSRFGLWADANANGINEAGEFRALDQAGITELSLVTDGLTRVIDGQTVHGIGTVKMSDNSTRNLADVRMKYDNAIRLPDGSGGQALALKALFSADGATIDDGGLSTLLFGQTSGNVVPGSAEDDVVVEDVGDDYIDGKEGNDWLFGGADNDMILGGAGDDKIFGGAGMDIAVGGSGNDVIMLDGGNDIGFGGFGDDAVSGGAGNDVLSGNGGNDQLFGEEGGDSLFGNDGADELLGLDGNDLLDGGAGNDIIVGGLGDDMLTGGAGADRLEGGTGVDSYYADGNDTIVDTDGQGSIYLNDLKLGEATRRRGETDYRDVAGRIYVKDGSRLLVKDSAAPGNAVLTIENFASGTLGIELKEQGAADNPAAIDAVKVDGYLAASGYLIRHTGDDRPYAWNDQLGIGATVSYSFVNSVPEYYASTDIENVETSHGSPFVAFNWQMQSSAQRAMAAWSNVADVRFVNDSAGTGQIAFGAYGFETDQTADGYAYELQTKDSTLVAGDVWLNAARPENLAPLPRNSGELTILHEIGHAIGLQHPYETDAWAYNDLKYTVLANAKDAAGQQTLSAWGGARPSTPMVLDIAAIQVLYGANYAYNAGDTTYMFSAELVAPDVKTIWDGGGKDTISAVNQATGAFIDLTPGHYSAIGTGALDRPNIGVALNCDIENATGSDHDDVILGNDLGNVLTGGKGYDDLEGGAGDDTLRGDDGSGGDFLAGGSGLDIYHVDDGDTIIDSDGRGVIHVGKRQYVLGAGKLVDAGGKVIVTVATGDRLGFEHNGEIVVATRADSGARQLVDSLTGLHGYPDVNGGGRFYLPDGKVVDAPAGIQFGDDGRRKLVASDNSVHWLSSSSDGSISVQHESTRIESSTLTFIVTRETVETVSVGKNGEIRGIETVKFKDGAGNVSLKESATRFETAGGRSEITRFDHGTGVTTSRVVNPDGCRIETTTSAAGLRQSAYFASDGRTLIGRTQSQTGATTGTSNPGSISDLLNSTEATLAAEVKATNYAQQILNFVGLGSAKTWYDVVVGWAGVPPNQPTVLYGVNPGGFVDNGLGAKGSEASITQGWSDANLDPSYWSRRYGSTSSNASLSVPAVANITVSWSPIVLDLDGDGIEMVAQQDSKVWYDVDGTGARHHTGWVGGDDALLAIDENGDGLITGAREATFGKWTAATTDTDMQALAAAFDSNGNGRLDAGDARFGDFRVWRDANGNGVTDAGELRTLAQTGIASVGLQATNIAYSGTGGHFAGFSTYTRNDGTQGYAGDVDVGYDGAAYTSTNARDYELDSYYPNRNYFRLSQQGGLVLGAGQARLYLAPTGLRGALGTLGSDYLTSPNISRPGGR